MNTPKLFFVSLAIVSMGLGTLADVQAQTTVQTTTSTQHVGTVSEFGPDMLVIRSGTSPEPVRYTYSATTKYVDETGTPMSIATVRSGQPVTVFYSKVGKDLVATRVVLRKEEGVTSVIPAVKAPAPVIVEKKTTTTTTTVTKKDSNDD